MVTLTQLLKSMIDRNASDLHLTMEAPPRLRIDGRLVPLKLDPLTPAETKELCYSILSDAQKLRFEEDRELDLSFGIRGMARFRANLFVQQGAVAGVFRRIPYQIPSFDELGLPEAARELTHKLQGLVLVTGPTGSGKSTTLASMLDAINQGTNCHILTIEDPVEYVHHHKKALVNQRELGTDTHSFPAALKYVLRQDPDVVLIGELRDQETMESALRVSETGHLVLATLHTNGAVQTINRVLDMFPSNHQGQVRAQLSFVLEGVVSQQLVPRASGQGRALACEILIPNQAVRHLIREEKIHQIATQMQLGQNRSGMQTMNQSLFQLIQRKEVSIEDGIAHSFEPEDLRSILKKAGIVSSGASA